MYSHLEKRFVELGALLALLIYLSACQTPATPTAPIRLTLLTHDSFAVSEGVLAQFEAQHQVQIQVLKSGDAGTLTNQLVLNQSAPFGDVAFGVDNTFISKALSANVFAPLSENTLQQAQSELNEPGEKRVVAVDFGDVCINYDIAKLKELNLPAPQTWAELAQPTYAQLLVVENPINSSPGLAFLLASIAAHGEDGYLAYWQTLLANGARVVEDWNTAYYSEFTRYGGTRPLVVSYASSPPAEVIFSEPRPDSAPTASITAPGMCFRQVEYAGVLHGTAHPQLAEQLVAFLLSETFQADLPLQMFVFPARPNTPLPSEFSDFATLAEKPAQLDPAYIASQREQWLTDWEAVVLNQ
jgi:thiamine transport system substrate-binding protein